MPSDNFAGTAPDMGAELKSTAADLGQKAGEQLDGGRTAAAGRMASAAESLHAHASDLPGGERVTGFAHSAADKLNSTADYIRDHDVSAMVADVQALVKRNPVPALLGAAALGFLIAKAFSRD